MTTLLAVWSPPATAGDAATKSTGKCMMWTAKSKTATVYLVGSLHEGTAEMYPLPEEMENAFAKADLLVEETKAGEDDDKFFDDDFWKKIHYAGDDTLPGHLTADQWTDVKSACELVGVPTATDVEKMKPEPLSLVLEYFADKKSGTAGVVGPPGIDDFFTGAAKKRNMPTEAFETLEFQVDLILGTPDKVGVGDLLKKVSRIKGTTAETDDSRAMWSAGNTEAMGGEIAKFAKRDPGWARHLLFDRNSRMADKIEQYLQGDKTVFVVVGCAHLVGDRGIVQSLRDDDVDVQQSPATKSPPSK